MQSKISAGCGLCSEAGLLAPEGGRYAGSRGLSRTLPNILGGQMTWGQIEDRSGPLHDAGVKDAADSRALRSVDRITMLPETFDGGSDLSSGKPCEDFTCGNYSFLRRLLRF